jgi:hypothetical protein
MKPKYLFIVGLPRTGTKLMTSILKNGLPGKIRISPETHFVGRLLGRGIRHRLRRFGNLKERANAEAAVEYMFSGRLNYTYWVHLKNGKLGICPKALVDAIVESDGSDRSLFDILIRMQPGLSQDMIVGEKTPGHLYQVPTLLRWYPDAKIIHTFRDPRAILISEWLKRIKKRPACLLTKLTNPIYSFLIVSYVILTFKYSIYLHQKYKRLYPTNYFLSIFEDLVQNPEDQVKCICQFLRIDFSEEMLKPNIFGSSYDIEYKKGFDIEALTRWKSLLRPWMKMLLSLTNTYSYEAILARLDG